MSSDPSHEQGLVIFTKPARPGRVKTRLIGELDAGQAAELHRAFLDDLVERLAGGRFELHLAWALDDDEEVPAGELPSFRQHGAGLGKRLFAALSRLARRHRFVAAVGSDHPSLPLAHVHRAFDRLAAGVSLALGPASDGGYYLIGLRAEALDRRIFEDIPWSTDGVLAATLERCRDLGLVPELLPEAADVDTPADLAALAEVLREQPDLCPRTRALLARWQRLTPASVETA